MLAKEHQPINMDSKGQESVGLPVPPIDATYGGEISTETLPELRGNAVFINGWVLFGRSRADTTPFNLSTLKAYASVTSNFEGFSV